MKLTTTRTALLVVDMQNAFLDDGGSMVQRGFDIQPLKKSISPCVSLVNLARSAKVPVIYTRYVYRSDYQDAGVRVREFAPETITTRSLAAGTWDIEIVDTLAPKSTEIIIDKNRPSAFINTSLTKTLSELNIESLVICGVTTNICVESTARDASQHDFRTFVVGDATAEFEEDRYKVALKTLAFIFAKVISVDDVEKAWVSSK